MITTPPVNLLTNIDHIIWWNSNMMNLHKLLPRPFVDFHKQRLNKQHYCFTGSEYRFWVWERDFVDRGKEIGWRVYVNNKKGVCFEVTENCNKDDTSLAFTDYLSAIDISLSVC